MGKLVIGTRRYSSWSLRGWLAVQLAGLDVAVQVLPIGEGPSAAITGATPAGLVPYLEHEGARVWESLNPALWPADRVARAEARSLAAEMHAGFRALRMAMPMNLGRDDFAGRGRTPEALSDIARIDRLWQDTRARFGGDGEFLFGASFGNADVMFAPVVARLLTYRPDLSAVSQAYCSAVRRHPLVSAWYDAASEEPSAWLLTKYESVT